MAHAIACPYAGSYVRTQPHSSGHEMRNGPRGCAFSTAGNSFNPDRLSSEQLYAQERKTMNELLLPEAPPKEVTKGLKNADELNATDEDVLAAALGAPARRVIMRAEEIGPKTGWKDGYLSSEYGFTPPDPSDSPLALRASPGRVWSDLCERMPGVVARGNVRNSILAVPIVYGTPDVIPDRALVAATVCLGILASVYRYEERNDGHEGIAVNPPPGTFKNITGDANDEEPETKGIPRNIAIPLRQVCTRMGRPLPHLTQFDVSIYNYKIRDNTSVDPYVARSENMDLRWPVFNDRGEAMFLLCMAEVHGTFQKGVELLARCQEAVMNRDTEGLLRDLIQLKTIIDQLPYVFHKISVNPNSGENFANPVDWGQGYAKFSAPLSNRVPALSGLALPLFLTMDAFLGRTSYKTFLGIEAVHLRRWLPLNIRAFITAIENHYRVPDFVRSSGDPRLHGILEGIVESYAGERGFMGTHRYKVYGFLEVVAKTGRTETNGNAGAMDTQGRPWEQVHHSLSESMIERLGPYRGKMDVKPDEMRGSFNECRFKARVMHRQAVDNDCKRCTGKVTFDLQGTGITFQPGDRLAVMPQNSTREIRKVATALGLDAIMDNQVLVETNSDWAKFSRHLAEVYRSSDPKLTVRHVLTNGHLGPLTKDLVMAVHLAIKASSSSILNLLSSEDWPIRGTIGDLLKLAMLEVPEPIWKHSFSLLNLTWLPELISIEVPRTYSISNASNELLPSMIDLTVSRTEAAIHPLLRTVENKSYGISSGFLNPDPDYEDPTQADQEVLVGLSRPINFQLPPSTTVPIAMFAGGSGIAPFRGFWQSRLQSGIGRNVLFLGVQSREKFLYEDELRDLVGQGSMELHTAFSRDNRGLIYNPNTRELVEKHMAPRYIDSTIVDQGALVSDLVMSKKQGGLGGYLYICGSVSVYETVISGIKKAIYKYQAATEKTADALLAAAFAERRFMLDIFMTPRPLSYNAPTISLSQLASHTGHRKGSRMWIGVHGSCYDVSDFLNIHPGGTLIVAASAGLDATKTFDDLAHTSNPEVSSLLSKYFIGHLATKPEFRSTEISQLYDVWANYLRTTVESLTTLFFEANSILEDSKVWFSSGLFNIVGVRKFYQFQSRLMQNAFNTLFGAQLQEIYLKLSFAVANSGMPNVRLPDSIGAITRAQSSAAAVTVSKEISEIGQFVCHTSQTAQFHEKGILRYARIVTELDVDFLEKIQDEAGQGMDAFDKIATMENMTATKLVKLAAYLLSILERITKHIESFYSTLAQHSIYHPEIESNPARSRWNALRRKIRDGSFFVLADIQELSGMQDVSSLLEPKARAPTSKVDFTEIFTRAQRELSQTVERDEDSYSGKGRRLAANHTARAAPPPSAPSSFDSQMQSSARKRISTFLEENKKSINRLSKHPIGFDLNSFIDEYADKSHVPLPLVIRPKSRSRSRSRSQAHKTDHPKELPPVPVPQIHAQGVQSTIFSAQKSRQHTPSSSVSSDPKSQNSGGRPSNEASETAPPLIARKKVPTPESGLPTVRVDSRTSAGRVYSIYDIRKGPGSVIGDGEIRGGSATKRNGVPKNEGQDTNATGSGRDILHEESPGGKAAAVSAM